ncbi:hypothetical protein Ga0466249_003456 [Sporomusaceae bacterium BoRhaA]|nr:hypothetical protein [Pelorhabdus rhamnosifermentans]
MDKRYLFPKGYRHTSSYKKSPYHSRNGQDRNFIFTTMVISDNVTFC